MTREKIWKVIKGLGTFTIDDVVIIAEEPDNKVLSCISGLINENKIVEVSQGKYVVRHGVSKDYEQKEQEKQKKTRKVKEKFTGKIVTELFDSGKEAEDQEKYLQAPVWARHKVDKYVKIIEESKGLSGEKLKFFIKKWNEKYPEMRTSYSAMMKARKKMLYYGKASLLAGYGRNGKISSMTDEMFSQFRDLYLHHSGPSVSACVKQVKAGFPEIPEGRFPGKQAFLRRLRKEFSQEEIRYYRGKG